MTSNSITDSRYRLYYNTDGTPRFYTMEDLEGDWISVDHQTFEQGRYDIIVKLGRIVSLSDSGTSRYVRVDQATPNSVACEPDDITIIVSEQQPHNLWDYRSE